MHLLLFYGLCPNPQPFKKGWPIFWIYKTKLCVLKQIHHNYGVFYFLTHPKYFLRFFLLSTSPTAPCSQSNFHQRSSLKTVHRTVFFTVGFKSLRFLCITKKQKTPQLWCLLFFWPTRSTFCVFSTFYLAYCGLFTVKLSSTLLSKNSPPDCFLYGRLQIP